MKILTKTIDVYVSSDGKEFLTRAACALHEEVVVQNLKKVKYYTCLSNPDLTEGRGYANVMYFAVLDDQYCHLQRALAYMIKNYGSPIAYVMGVSPMPNWTVPELVTIETFKEALPTRLGSYAGTIKQVFISKKSLPDFPEPIWIE